MKSIYRLFFFVISAAATVTFSQSTPRSGLQTKALKTFYLVTRNCRFSRWGKNIPDHDVVIKSQAAITILNDDVEYWSRTGQHRNWLPLVMVEAGDETIMGFMDRRCMDPGPLQEFEFNNFNQDPNKFLPINISPSIQQVISLNLNPQALAVDPMPLNAAALLRVSELQKQAGQLSVDFGALAEMAAKESVAEQTESLAAFLTTSQIEFLDLLGLHLIESSQQKELAKMGGEALLLAYGELLNSKTVNCNRVRNGVRLFFATGMKLVRSDAVLAAYGMLFSNDPKMNECGAELAEARTFLSALNFARPASPYATDQAWKQTWGIAPDETIKAAFPGKKVRIIRDDGDVSSEKRVIAEVAGFGVLEQYDVRSNGAAEFRWIKQLEKNGSRSTADLRRRLKKFY